MKAALMTEAGIIPGVAHFQRLNPASELEYYRSLQLSGN